MTITSSSVCVLPLFAVCGAQRLLWAVLMGGGLLDLSVFVVLYPVDGRLVGGLCRCQLDVRANSSSGWGRGWWCCLLLFVGMMRHPSADEAALRSKPPPSALKGGAICMSAASSSFNWSPSFCGGEAVLVVFQHLQLRLAGRPLSVTAIPHLFVAASSCTRCASPSCLSI